MLKKLVHILFALLFFLGSIGMTISEHYCGKSLKSISVNSTPDNCCGESSSCCHNESFTIKIENEFALFIPNFDFNTLVISLAPAIELIQSEAVVSNLFTILSWEGPPPKIQTLLSKLQVYLI